MTISYSQARQLLTSISNAAPDQLDCDGCFEMISEFAEAEIRGDSISSSLDIVRQHLKQCACCAYEYEALLEAIQAADELEVRR